MPGREGNYDCHFVRTHDSVHRDEDVDRSAYKCREGEKVPDLLSRELVKGTKRTSNNADTRRLTFIVPDQAAAVSWHAKTILLRGKRQRMLSSANMERNGIYSPLQPATSTGRHQLYYQVRGLFNGVAASII